METGCRTLITPYPSMQQMSANATGRGNDWQRERSLTSRRLPQVTHRPSPQGNRDQAGVRRIPERKLVYRCASGRGEPGEAGAAAGQAPSKSYRGRSDFERARQRERQESHGKPPTPARFPRISARADQQEERSSHDQSIPFPCRATEIDQRAVDHQAIPGKLSHHRNDVGKCDDGDYHCQDAFEPR